MVGYSLNERMIARLFAVRLVWLFGIKSQLVHSDRGSQYCNHEYRNMLENMVHGSMSNKGDCYNNAPIESSWSILKNELVHHRNYKTIEEAKVDIIKYIELFYNQ